MSPRLPGSRTSHDAVEEGVAVADAAESALAEEIIRRIAQAGPFERVLPNGDRYVLDLSPGAFAPWTSTSGHVFDAPRRAVRELAETLLRGETLDYDRAVERDPKRFAARTRALAARMERSDSPLERGAAAALREQAADLESRRGYVGTGRRPKLPPDEHLANEVDRVSETLGSAELWRATRAARRDPPPSDVQRAAAVLRERVLAGTALAALSDREVLSSCARRRSPRAIAVALLAVRFGTSESAIRKALARWENRG